MLEFLKKILPAPLKKIIRSLIKKVKYTYRSFSIRRPIANDEQIKIIVGAAETYQDGWYSTNEQWLDISNASDWNKIFKGKKLVTNLVAEHVFEHLTYDQARAALENISNHLVDGGLIRIAIPDGYNPDPTYIKHVGINGIGDDAADHKQLLNIDIMRELFESTGFETKHIEGYNKDQKLISKNYSKEDGYIMRSRINGSHDNKFECDFPDSSTSLIVDGIKKHE